MSAPQNYLAVIKVVGIGVVGDELHATEADLDHPVDGVDTATTDTHNLDDRQIVLRCCHDAYLSGENGGGRLRRPTWTGAAAPHGVADTS